MLIVDAYPIGTPVTIGDIIGYIDGLCLEGNPRKPRLLYRVAYWQNGERNTVMLYKYEFAVKAQSTKIGFKSR